MRSCPLVRIVEVPEPAVAAHQLRARGEPGGGQRGGGDARARTEPGVERLGHRSKVALQSGRRRRGHVERVSGRLKVEAHQVRRRHLRAKCLQDGPTCPIFHPEDNIVDGLVLAETIFDFGRTDSVAARGDHVVGTPS
jgi:hypothetical protein